MAFKERAITFLGKQLDFGVAGLGEAMLRNWKPYFFGKEPFQVDIEGIKMLVRPKSPDLYVIYENMVNGQYEPTHDIGKVETAADLGANIGSATVWLEMRYAPKTIVAVEFEEENFRLLEKNLNNNGYEGDVIRLKKAVYSEDGKVGVKINKGHSGHHMVDEKSHDPVAESMSLDSVLKAAGIDKVDFLKMDIEGSERWILTEANKDLFLKRVRYVNMESHGPQQGGDDVEAAVKYFQSLGWSVRTKQVPYPGALRVEAFNPKILEQMGITVPDSPIAEERENRFKEAIDKTVEAVYQKAYALLGLLKPKK